MTKDEFNAYREAKISLEIKDMGGEASINDVINNIWDKTPDHMLRKLGWRFFVHINKIPSKMENLEWTGKVKMGEYKYEKIWRIK